MIDLAHLLAAADAYKSATGLEDDKTVSSRAFGDSKKLSALRAGADITVSRFNLTMAWFRDHWPDDAPPPEWLIAADNGAMPGRGVELESAQETPHDAP